MAYRLKISYILVLMLHVSVSFFYAQEEAVEKTGQELNVVDWDEITNGETFIETSEPVKKREKPEIKDVDVSTPFYELEGFRNVAIVILIAAMMVVLFFIVANRNKNLKVKKELEYSIAEAEMNIDKSDLNYLLQQALDQKEYKLALRIYYLIIIKELNARGFISYKKDKTNYAYMLEMQPNSNYGNFKNVTRIYEYFWYGDKELNADKFEPITKVMGDFVSQIKDDK